MRSRAILVSEMPRDTMVEAPEAAGNGKCCHHWLIEKSNGPISRGICKYCHEERDFSNSPPQYSSRRTYDPSNRKTVSTFQF